MSEWWFKDLKIGDPVIINNRLEAACAVTDCFFDVGPIRYRRRDGRALRSCERAYPAVGDHLAEVLSAQGSGDIVPPSEAEQITALTAEVAHLKRQITHLKACSAQHSARWAAAEEREARVREVLTATGIDISDWESAGKTVDTCEDKEYSRLWNQYKAKSQMLAAKGAATIRQALAILGAGGNEINEREKEDA